jgi:hypothetical protein
MKAVSRIIKRQKLVMRSCGLCCAIFLSAVGTGCGGGFVYRPDPEPRQEFPVDISVEQKIYAATAKQPQKAGPAVEPAQTEKPAPAASTQPAEHFYSVHLFSFKRPDFAHSAARKIAAQTGQPVFIKETELPGSGTWQRLYVGMFPSEAAAKVLGGKMKSDGIAEYFCVYKLPAPLTAEPRQ